MRVSSSRRIRDACWPLQALLDNLKIMYGEYHRQQTPVSLQLSHLFIVSPSARVICTKFSKGNVWFLDATHETIATVYLFCMCLV
uniref:RxLR effector candidate protein n=1 Tax=Hyaloperonospora arabidopsidis (strain Emoy2) TaxID=559515 RepID=M4BFW4_HYAAE